SIASARERLREYADDLEQKVQERTAELNRTLGEVQLLKAKPDGDYFLTSLLLKPLAANDVDSELIRVDSFVKQHKQFRFRKWQEEIGGDLNKVHGIRLRDRTYVAFVNADAMGKSMQGAVG